MSAELSRSLAVAVASARRALDSAMKTHSSATAKAEAIANRVAKTRQRIEEITHNRLSGKVIATETVEQYSLGLDIVGLQRLHGTAQVEADALLLDVENARLALDAAEGQWQRNIDEVTYSSLLVRARQIEQALLEAIRATTSAGKLLGHRNTRQSWVASKDLERAMQGAV
jgi:hypothetical protein